MFRASGRSGESDAPPPNRPLGGRRCELKRFWAIGRVRHSAAHPPSRRMGVRLINVLGDRARGRFNHATARYPTRRTGPELKMPRAGGRVGESATLPPNRPIGGRAKGLKLFWAVGRVRNSPGRDSKSPRSPTGRITALQEAIAAIINRRNRRNRRRVSCALFKWQFRRFRRFAIAEIATRRLTRAIFWRFQ